MTTETTDLSTPGEAVPTWRRWLVPALVALVTVALNVAAYFLLPANLDKRLGGFGYLGIFLITLVSNATVVVPVPYYGLVARLAQDLDFTLVVVLGALGSTVGESVAFFVGRSGRAALDDTRFFHWMQRQLRHPWRAFGLLLLLSAPPNPAFDVAGLAAGALGLPFWMFAVAVFLGRLVRLTLITLLPSLFGV